MRCSVLLLNLEYLLTDTLIIYANRMYLNSVVYTLHVS
jgi:hypothetical protein